MKFLSTTLTLIALSGFVYIIAVTPDDPKDVFSGRVTWVSDGDTFKVSGHDWSIRVWGIDAPERDNSAGQASREFVTQLIKGKILTCEKVAVDRYRRTVSKCWHKDKDIAQLILEASHAIEYCSFSGGYYGRC
jgi:endonuclease YncB( thermonuclease family)